MTVPVASSMAPTRVAKGRSGPNQRWRDPSVCSSIPARGMRSRRLRWRGGRCDARRRQPRFGEQAAQRPLGHDDPLALGQQLGEVGPVDARIGGGGEEHEALPEFPVGAVGRWPSGVAVAQGVGAIARIGGEESAHLARGAVQDGGRLFERQGPVGEVNQHRLPLVGSSATVGSWASVHAHDSDKVAGRLGRDRIAGRPHTIPVPIGPSPAGSCSPHRSVGARYDGRGSASPRTSMCPRPRQEPR